MCELIPALRCDRSTTHSTHPSSLRVPITLGTVHPSTDTQMPYLHRITLFPVIACPSAVFSAHLLSIMSGSVGKVLLPRSTYTSKQPPANQSRVPPKTR